MPDTTINPGPGYRLLRPPSGDDPGELVEKRDEKSRDAGKTWTRTFAWMDAPPEQHPGFTYRRRIEQPEPSEPEPWKPSPGYCLERGGGKAWVGCRIPEELQRGGFIWLGVSSCGFVARWGKGGSGGCCNYDLIGPWVEQPEPTDSEAESPIAPASLAFEDVNDWVHRPDQQYEHLQDCCLSLAAALERASEQPSEPTDAEIAAAIRDRLTKRELLFCNRTVTTVRELVDAWRENGGGDA